MSYDVDMVVDTGSEYPVSVHDCGNYTYNVSPMFREAFGGKGLRELDGLTGEDARLELRLAITYMENHPEAMNSMNPPNGWGDSDGALRYLRSILEGCLAHPKAVVLIT